MLPFGIPRSFAKQFSDNQEALKHSEKIFGLGLAYVVVDFFIFLPILGIIFYIATLILFILYWVEVVKFKNNFLVNTDNETASACCYTE